MTTLNQRILIPNGPASIWAIVSDINKNPSWQADCQSVAFLTTLRAGPRVRWRYSSPEGSDFVVETTAWYDGLGYEYTYVDGAPFRESKGRLRLQETPDGTVVIWTLNYEMGGLLSSIRNTLGIQRHYQQLMVDSLKALYTEVRAHANENAYESRSLMRDAPDYEARAQYVPRHPVNADEPISERLIVEPPIEDDDTRPTQTVVPISEAAEEVAAEATNSAASDRVLASTPESTSAVSRGEADISEPATVEEASDETATAETAGVTNPSDTVSEPAAAAEVAATPEAIKEESVDDDAHAPYRPPQGSDSRPIAATVEEEAEPQPIAEPPVRPTDTEPSARPTDTEPLITGLDRFGPKIDTTDIDTREISIWEVFDVPPPSASQQLEPVELDDEPQVKPDILIEPASTPTPIAAVLPPALNGDSPVLTVGFRLLARKDLVALRRRK